MAERQLLVKILGDSKGAQSAVEALGGPLDALHGHLGAVGAAIGGALSVGAITGFAKSSVDAFQDVANATRNLQRLTGESAEDSSRLRTAFQLTGIDAEAGANAIKKMSKALEGGDEATDKSKEKISEHIEKLKDQAETLISLKNPTQQQKDKLAELQSQLQDLNDEYAAADVDVKKYHLSLTDANGQQKNTTQLLEDAADVFKKLGPGTESTALAMKLFGKSGTDMLPFLLKGKEGVQQLEKESDKLGLTLTQKNVDALAKSKAASREWHAAIQGLQVQIGAYLQPVLTQMAVWLAEHIPPAMAMLREKFQEAQPYIERFANFVRQDVLPVVQRIGEVISEYVPPALEALRAAFDAVVSWVQQHWPQIRAVVEAVLGAIEAFWRTWGGNITRVVEGVFGGIRSMVQGAMDTIRGIIDVVMGLIHGDWSRVWDGLREIVSGLWEQVRGIVEAGLALVRGVVEAGMRLIAGAFSTALDAIVGFFSGLAARLIGGLGDLGGTIWNAIKASVEWLGGKFNEGLQAIIAYFTALPGNIIAGIGDLGGAVWSAIRSGWEGIKSHLLSPVSDAVAGIIKFVTDLPGQILALVGNVASAGESVGSAILNGIKSGISGAVGELGDIGAAVGRGIQNAVNELIHQLNNTIIFKGFTIPGPGFLPDVHVPGLPDIPEIHLFAKGGIVTKPTLGIVGEAGPEAVIPLSRAGRTLAGIGGTGSTLVVHQNFYGPVTREAVPHLQQVAVERFGRDMRTMLRGAA